MKSFRRLFANAFFFVPAAFATTINIPGDYSTIQGGIDAASEGDTVPVQAGPVWRTSTSRGRTLL